MFSLQATLVRRYGELMVCSNNATSREGSGLAWQEEAQDQCYPRQPDCTDYPMF